MHTTTATIDHENLTKAAQAADLLRQDVLALLHQSDNPYLFELATRELDVVGPLRVRLLRLATLAQES